jgi:hypothetical protein
MKKYCITFGGQAYDGVTKNIVERAPQLGADEVLVYDDFWLMQQDFYKQNKWLWEHHHKRGFGWYCWKPYIIWHTLQTRCQDGDIVMFIDADTYPVNDFSKLYEICEKDGGIMLFAVEAHKQISWCKADCSLVMGQVPAIMDTESRAGVARFMLFQKGKWKATQFLMEWLTYCVNPLANTFEKSILVKQEHPMFQEHRAEQAIMTNLAHKYGLELYREADQTGEWSVRHRDLYPMLFLQADPHTQNVTREIGNGSIYRNV